MLDPLFSEAFCHAPGGHTILGRKLHPLCALDLLALEAINSPFLFDGGQAELSDLLLVVWMLSNPHSKDCTIGHLEPTDACKEWINTLEGKVDMVRDCKAIQTYINDYYSLPEIMRTIADRAITPLGCPWMLSTVVTITRQLHIPLYEAWTMGIGQLIWYRASIEELDNEESRVVDPDMRSQLQQAKDASRIMERLPDETDEAFAARTGLSLEDIVFFSGNGR